MGKSKVLHKEQNGGIVERLRPSIALSVIYSSFFAPINGDLWASGACVAWLNRQAGRLSRDHHTTSSKSKPHDGTNITLFLVVGGGGKV